MPAPKEKFPTFVYIAREQDSGESYLVAHERLDTCVMVGDREKVAVYKLTEILTVEGEVHVVGTESIVPGSQHKLEK